MTYTTELLENESGIQYQGVKDKSGGTGTYPITGLMTGIFKRGRFDKPMTITNENIRAQLGYDPKNSYYVAVQDVLNSGVPSVQVLRLEGSAKVLIDHAYVTFGQLDTDSVVKINGVLFSANDRDLNFEDFIQLLFRNGLGIYQTYDSLGCLELFRFQNVSNQVLNVEISGAVIYHSGLIILQPQENKTIQGVNTGKYELDEGVDLIKFSLAPNQEFPLIPPSQIGAFRRGIYSDFYGKNNANESYHYQFVIDDQLLTDPSNGNTTFSINNNDEAQSLCLLLADFGVWSSRTLFNGNWVQISLYAMVGQIKKIWVKQLGNIEPTSALYVGVADNAAKTNTATELSFEGYSYDPLDIEKNEV